MNKLQKLILLNAALILIIIVLFPLYLIKVKSVKAQKYCRAYSENLTARIAGVYKQKGVFFTPEDERSVKEALYKDCLKRQGLCELAGKKR